MPAKPGWCIERTTKGDLIDPDERKVRVHKPGEPVQTLNNPDRIPGGSLLPEFVLDLKPIWEPGP